MKAEQMNNKLHHSIKKNKSSDLKSSITIF